MGEAPTNLSPNEWLKAGDYYRGRGNFEKALDAYAEARLALTVEMGECFAGLGKLEEAAIMFEEVLDARDRDCRAWSGLGNVHLQQGNLGEAENAFRNALHLNARDAKALCGLGMATLRQGNEEEGVRLLGRALDENPDNPDALEGLMQIALERKDPVMAAEAERRAQGYLRRNPGNGNFRTILDGFVAGAGLRAMPPISSAPASRSLEEKVERFRAAPADKVNLCDLVKELRSLGCHDEARSVCALYLRQCPDDVEVLRLQTNSAG